MIDKLRALLFGQTPSDGEGFARELAEENGGRARISIGVTLAFQISMLVGQILTLSTLPNAVYVHRAGLFLPFAIVWVVIEAILAIALWRMQRGGRPGRCKMAFSYSVFLLNILWGATNCVYLYWIDGAVNVSVFYACMFFQCYVFFIRPQVGVPLVTALSAGLLAAYAVLPPRAGAPVIEQDQLLAMLEVTVFCTVLAVAVSNGIYRNFVKNYNQTYLIRKLNEELSHQVRTDSLTQIYNRREFTRSLRLAADGAAESGQWLSVAIVDVDYFKQYNDTYGHIEGDECLLRLAQALRAYFDRPGAMVARYGGEEFAVFVTGVPPEEAEPLLRGAVGAIESLDIPHAESIAAPHVTISAGAYMYRPAAEPDYAQALRIADEALYDAKTRGRNRLCVRVAEQASAG